MVEDRNVAIVSHKLGLMTVVYQELVTSIR